MKKCTMIILAMALLSMENYAEKPALIYERDVVSNSLIINDNPESDYDLSLINLQVDVLGVLFFGPQISLDFQFANLIAVGPYVRWHYAGVLYQAVVTDWFEDKSSVATDSYSYGGQIKFLIPAGSGRHRPFIGLGAEKSQGTEIFEWTDDLRGDRINEFEQNIFHVDFGYRYLSGAAFNLSVGLGIGISKDTKNIGYYENEPDLYDSYTLETRVLPMIQLQLGWQLGK